MMTQPPPLPSICPIHTGKRQFLDLLLLADEQESMIERYLERGDLYILTLGNKTCALCVVTRENEETCELKNLAVRPAYQRQGYGRMLVEYVILRYASSCRTLFVGTGDSPLTVPFYKRCGFQRSHRIPNFFIHHYDHPIIEAGHRLTDMIYLRIDLSSAIEIVRATDADHPHLIAIWERAVRATHDFLSTEDFDYYRSRMPFYLSLADLHVCRIIPSHQIAGFLGLSGDSVEMLFVDAPFRGTGIGRQLLNHAIQHFGACRLDVNEQNTPATKFYTRMGFRIAGRSATDSDGRPYPLLHLLLEKE